MGPWWMAVEKIEADLRWLREVMAIVTEGRTDGERTDAIALAETEIERAAAEVRRASRLGAPEQLMAAATAALALARLALEQADPMIVLPRRYERRAAGRAARPAAPTAGPA